MKFLMQVFIVGVENGEILKPIFENNAHYTG